MLSVSSQKYVSSPYIYGSFSIWKSKIVLGDTDATCLFCNINATFTPNFSLHNMNFCVNG